MIVGGDIDNAMNQFNGTVDDTGNGSDKGNGES
jgi:hypothetical protein